MVERQALSVESGFGDGIDCIGLLFVIFQKMQGEYF